MYNTKYILPFTNDLNELYEIYFDFLDYEGDSTLLTGTDDCLTLRCTTGDENKLEPILGTECLINIWVDESKPISINDLIAEQDNQIRVTVYRDEDYTTAVFQGFIVVEDNSEPFLDPPFALSVRALDGLGLLKGVDLGDLNGLRYVSIQSVMAWIMQILYKTGQTLNLRAYFNFYESSFAQNIGALEQIWLDAITFSQGDAFNATPTDPTIDILATSADDCYTALEKIVRCLRCRLFQENGVWNLVSLYEYLNPNGFSYREYAFGPVSDGLVAVDAIGSGLNIDMSASIGKDDITLPVAEDQIRYLKLATKWLKLTYAYDQSQNKICNQDFSEGTRDVAFDEVISSSVIDPTISPVVNLTTQAYDVYCWNHFDGNVGGGAGGGRPFPSSSASVASFIRVVIDQLGYEKERFLVIQNPAHVTYLQSSTFLIDNGDALVITMEMRTRNSHSGTPLFPFAWVLMAADDGTFWALNGAEGPGIGSPEANKATWVQVDSNYQNSFGNTPVVSWDEISGSQWNSWTSVATGNYKPSIAPVSGTVRLYLIGDGYGDEIWYRNIDVKLTPFLQGSYEQLSGDYNYSSSNAAIKQTESDDVEISDSPKRYFKGALLRANGDLCTPTWARAGVSESYRFTQLMERIMYNHLRRMNQKIEGTFKGLVYIPADDPTIIKPNGFLNGYTFTQHDDPTKRFMCTSFEKDYTTGQWRGVFVETLQDDNDTGFALPDQFQFSYIFATN